MAHWLSETSPRKVREVCPWPALAKDSIPAAPQSMARSNTFRYMETPSRTASRQHRKLHVHAFMVFAANHCAYHFVSALLVWNRQGKLLRSGLEQKVPAIDSGTVLGSQQGETVN